MLQYLQFVYVLTSFPPFLFCCSTFKPFNAISFHFSIPWSRKIESFKNLFTSWPKSPLKSSLTVERSNNLYVGIVFRKKWGFSRNQWEEQRVNFPLGRAVSQATAKSFIDNGANCLLYYFLKRRSLLHLACVVSDFSERKVKISLLKGGSQWD